MALPAIVNLGDQKMEISESQLENPTKWIRKGSKSSCVPLFVRDSDWNWEEWSERFEVGSLYVRRKKMVTEFLMVLSITNFGILCCSSI